MERSKTFRLKRVGESSGGKFREARINAESEVERAFEESTQKIEKATRSVTKSSKLEGKT